MMKDLFYIPLDYNGYRYHHDPDLDCAQPHEQRSSEWLPTGSSPGML